MATEVPIQDQVRAAREHLARHLADLHRLHLVLAEDSRAIKDFTTAGHPLAEIELATELLEQYLAASNAFLENMRGRFEARLALLRRGEPAAGLRRDAAPGHGAFWLAFSRLCAALRRVDRAAQG
ncbi:MAG TPA: hypothetical protein VNE67_00805 [Acetobacteraceae bacterium]|nr:hypothetical protein [Acetobacteraceae bacterium]